MMSVASQTRLLFFVQNELYWVAWGELFCFQWLCVRWVWTYNSCNVKFVVSAYEPERMKSSSEFKRACGPPKRLKMPWPLDMLRVSGSYSEPIWLRAAAAAEEEMIEVLMLD